MIKPALALAAALTLSACATVSQSRLNPLNWFGSSVSAPVGATTDTRPLIPAGTQFGAVERRGLIDQVAAMRIAPTASGAIVHATGVAETQGQYNAELVTSGFESGTLTLTFHVAVPSGAQSSGTPRTREITVAKVLSAADLTGVRQIRVQAARNTQTATR